MYGTHTAPMDPKHENLRIVRSLPAEAKFSHEKSGNRRNGKAPSNMVAASRVQPFLSNSRCDPVPPMKAVNSVETFAEAALWHSGLHDVGEITLDRFCFGI